MTMMHQILSAWTTVKGRAKLVRDETEKSFKDPKKFFEGSRVAVTHDTVAGKPEDITENFPITTVEARVAFHLETLSTIFDLELNKEDSNGMGLAKAELIVGGKSYGMHSAVCYLALSNQLEALRNTLKDAPSFEVGADAWVQDTDKGDGYYKTTKSTTRTQNQDRVVKVPGFTDESKTPTQKIVEIVQLGKIVTTSFCSKWTSIRKHEVLGKLDAMIVDVNDALSRANSCDVSEVAKQKLATELLKTLL